MNRLTHFIAAVVLLSGIEGLLAGPERIDAKDYKATPEPAPPPPPCNWTGFYVGVHGGYGWGDSSALQLDENDPPYKFNEDGFLGGGQLGFNYQLGSFFVFGLEGEFSGSTIDDNANFVQGIQVTVATLENDWTGALAGRVGLSLLQNRLLLYAKGGVAFAHFNFGTANDETPQETFDSDKTRTIALVGGGLEYALTCHWSAKIEYKHLFLGSADFHGIEHKGNDPNPDSLTYDISGDQNLVEAGFNYRF